MLFANTPVLCGHRGSGRGVVAGQRENTVASALAAVEAGLRWVELDARFNADDVLVSHHDPAVGGRFVSEMTTAETDAAGIARFEAFLDELPEEVGIDLEVKTSLEDARRPRERTTAALVGDLVARRGGGRRPLLVSSFDASVLGIVRERAPAVPLGLLTWARFPLRKAIPAAVHLGAEVVAPHFTSFPVGGEQAEREAWEFVAVAHDAGLEVVAWCPQPPVAEQLAAAGVDCIIVDDVPSAVARYRSALDLQL